MKSIYVVTLILLLAICVTCEENENDLSTTTDTMRVCEPESTKMIECNRCRCSLNGKFWKCTKKACPNHRRARPSDENFICTPNETFKSDCNTCTCNDLGNGANCTKLECNNIQASSKGYRLQLSTTLKETTTTSASSTTTQQCVPFTRFRKDCNNCFCTETGIAICTLRGCGVRQPNISIINERRTKRQISNQNQKPEKIYTFADLYDPNFSCIPSQSFKVDCNTCWCSADAKRPRFCTRINCNPKTYPTNIQNNNS
ncbi:hypothetical protein PVAND_009148 [Polypedilum vanderplanki]|uniref:Pacifastin domain-containing protein n=1 Tax=Polypedilum vanderplanki TaxID=319348 RepID=A0A9J6CBT6_POLVA|nr:hypothetical protein PVAND_009148 [Polypedilum vanderplanki]